VRKSILVTLGIAALIAGAGAAHAQTLGTAGQFNVFIFNDDTQEGVDAWGRVAVGHNASFNGPNGGYAVNSSNIGGGYGLIVGNDYTNRDTQTYGGVLVGHNATINNPSISGGLAVNNNLTTTNGTINGGLKYGGALSNSGTTISGGTTTGTTIMPFSFGSIQADLNSKSSYYGSLAATGTTNVAFNGFTLSGSSSSLNIFSVSGSALASATSFTINAPSGSTALININGTSDQMQNFGFTLNGIDKQQVLFNFYQATSLMTNGIGVQGTILAPLATYNFAGGNVDGTIIANNISGRGEAHNYLFTGTLPTVPTTSVPEPGAYALLAACAMGGAFTLRRRFSRK
jgi:choice-of-anchor A domain-containing protein